MKLLKKTIAILLMITVCLSTLLISASARSSLYLDAYRAWLTPESKGRIDITVDVQAYDDMTEIGAKRIEVFESKDGGTTWTSDKIYLKLLFPEMIAKNTWFYYKTPISHSGTPGYRYYAVVTVYAGNNTGSDSRNYTTPIVIAKN